MMMSSAFDATVVIFTLLCKSNPDAESAGAATAVFGAARTATVRQKVPNL